MIHTDPKYRNYLQGLWLLLLAVLGLSLLALNWQPSTVRAQDEGESVERFAFEESADRLTIHVDLSGDEGVMLKLQEAAEGEGEADAQTGEEATAEEGDGETGEQPGGENADEEATGEAEEPAPAAGDELPRVEGADGQPVWQYTGPSEVEEINCDSRSWADLGYAGSVAAALADDNEADKPLKASASINLPSDASDRTWYCFRVPFVPTEGGTNFYYSPYTLKEAAAPEATDLLFTDSAPQDENGLPGSVTASAAEGTEVDPDSWQYVKVEAAEDCGAENDGLAFNEPAAANSTAAIASPDDAGAFYCFRVALAGSGGTEHLYDVYQVRELIQPAGEVDEEGSSTGLWVALAIIGGIAVIGLVFYVTKGRGGK